MFRSSRTATLVGVAATLALSAGALSLAGLPAQAEPVAETTPAVDVTALSAERMSVIERATRAADDREQRLAASQQKKAKADLKKRLAERRIAVAADRERRIEARKAREAREAAEARVARASAASRSSVRSVAPSGGDTRAIGKAMAAQRGWTGNQWTCLNNLWTKESGWRTTAGGSSGAYGIPQALPGSKMYSAGSDWRTNPATQIEWGLNYIGGRYGSPCGAWNSFLSKGWY